jgi:hypothetical protein
MSWSDPLTRIELDELRSPGRDVRKQLERRRRMHHGSRSVGIGGKGHQSCKIRSGEHELQLRASGAFPAHHISHRAADHGGIARKSPSRRSRTTAITTSRARSPGADHRGGTAQSRPGASVPRWHTGRGGGSRLLNEGRKSFQSREIGHRGIRIWIPCWVGRYAGDTRIPGHHRPSLMCRINANRIGETSGCPAALGGSACVEPGRRSRRACPAGPARRLRLHWTLTLHATPSAAALRSPLGDLPGPHRPSRATTCEGHRSTTIGTRTSVLYSRPEHAQGELQLFRQRLATYRSPHALI